MEPPHINLTDWVNFCLILITALTTVITAGIAAFHKIYGDFRESKGAQAQLIQRVEALSNRSIEDGNKITSIALQVPSIAQATIDNQSSGEPPFEGNDNAAN